MNQNEAILAYLKKGHKITPIEALERFGSFHLASRIDELHKRGIRTVKRMVKLPSGKRVAEYQLDETEVTA